MLLESLGVPVAVRLFPSQPIAAVNDKQDADRQAEFAKITNPFVYERRESGSRGVPSAPESFVGIEKQHRPAGVPRTSRKPISQIRRKRLDQFVGQLFALALLQSKDRAGTAGLAHDLFGFLVLSKKPIQRLRDPLNRNLRDARGQIEEISERPAQADERCRVAPFPSDHDAETKIEAREVHPELIGESAAEAHEHIAIDMHAAP